MSAAWISHDRVRGRLIRRRCHGDELITVVRDQATQPADQAVELKERARQVTDVPSGAASTVEHRMRRVRWRVRPDTCRVPSAADRGADIRVYGANLRALAGYLTPNPPQG